jgi:hypothetical protein
MLPSSPQKYSGMDGMGLRADQFAHFVDDGLALLVPGLDRAAEQAALHLAGDQGQLAVAADEGAGEIRAARNVAPPDVLHAQRVELLRAPVLRLGRQRRARGAQRPHGLEARQSVRSTPAFMQLAKNAAPAPKKVTPRSAPKRHSVAQSGLSLLPAGLPS